MSNSKFLDQSGVQSLWSKILNEDYVNSGTLTTVINAIDETKQDKITGAASTITSNNLNSNNILISNSNGKVAASGFGSGYLNDLVKIGDIETTADNAELLAKLALPGTLKWDGYIGDRPHVVLSDDGLAVAIHLYDDDFLYQAIINGEAPEILFGTYSHYGEVSSIELSKIISNDDGSTIWAGSISDEIIGIIFYAPQDNYTEDSLVFPKRGIYAYAEYYNFEMEKFPINYISTIGIEGYSFPAQNKDSSEYFETVEGGSGVVNIGDTITWDGNVEDRYVVGPWVFMSNSAPSYDELNSGTVQISVKYPSSGNIIEYSEYHIETPQPSAITIEVPSPTDPLDFVVPILIVLEDIDTGRIGMLKKGTYFFGDENSTHTTSFTLEGFNFLVEETTKETVLKTKHLPADLRYVGAAFDTVKDDNGTIEYDGEIEGRLAVKIAENLDAAVYFVHVSDLVPDINALLSQEGTGTLCYLGEYRTTSALMTKLVDGVYGCIVEGFDIPVIVLAEQDNINVEYNSEIINIPKKGVYFFNGSGVIYVSSVTHPALTSERVELKEEALPSSMFEKIEKFQPFELKWKDGEGLIPTDDLDSDLYKLYDSYVEPDVFLNNGYKLSYGGIWNGEFEDHEVTFSPVEAVNTFYIDDNGCYSLAQSTEADIRILFVVSKEGFTYTWANPSPGSIELDEGIYLCNFFGAYEYFNVTGYINAPATQIKKSALPEEVFAHTQADYNVHNPESKAYIKNRPFHDEYDPVIIDTNRFGQKVVFESDEDMGFTYNEIPQETLDYFDINVPELIIPGNTYTLAVGDKRYTGVAFEVEEDGVSALIISDASLENLMAGFSFKFLWMFTQGVGAQIAINDNLEPGEYWCAIVEGTEIRDTITKEEISTGTILQSQYGNTVRFLHSHSDEVPTKEELYGGFEIVLENYQDGTQVTLTEESPYVEIIDNPLGIIYEEGGKGVALKISAQDFGQTGGMWLQPAVLISLLQEDIEEVGLHNTTYSCNKGVYFTIHADIPVQPVSFRLKQSATFVPKIPMKKLDEKYLPDTIRKPTWEKLENKPFHDGWTSVLFDSYKAIEGMPFGIPFENYGGVLITELDLNELNLPIELDFSKVVPGNTYTIAVGDKICTGESFEVIYSGVKCVAIGNGALFGDDMAGYGDPNADFLWGYMPLMNAVAMMVMSDAESGEYWLAMVEGDRIGDTIVEADSKDYEQTTAGGITIGVRVSDKSFTEADLANGFTVTLGASKGYDVEDIILTQDEVSIDPKVNGSLAFDEWFINNGGIVIGGNIPDVTVLRGIMIGTLPNDYTETYEDGTSFTVKKGTYFFTHEYSSYKTVSFKINNSTIFAPSEPIKQIEEKFIPDSIARIEDILKYQIQSDYLQNSLRKNCFIKNKPFHDGWDSCMFDTKQFIEEGIPFEFNEEYGGVIAPLSAIGESLGTYYTFRKMMLNLINGNKYIIAIGDYLYSGVAIVDENTGISLGGIDQNFIFVYSEDGQIVGSKDIQESGNYRVSIWDADEIKDTLYFNDGKIYDEFFNSWSYFENVFFTPEDLIDGFEITIVYGNSTYHFTEANSEIIEEGNKVNIYVRNDGSAYNRLAVSCHYEEEFKTFLNDVTELRPRGTYLSNLETGTPLGKVVSFKVNNPLVFMPKEPSKKIDKRFLPDDIGGGANEEEVNAIIAAPKTQFTLIDQVTGENYIVCMRDGNLVTYKAE